MQYIARALERKFNSMSKVFKVVMVVGARQIGKSTMLQHLAAQDHRTYVNMDVARNRELAQRDPELFFQAYKPPLLIDEIQKAPALLEQIKIICDQTDDRGLFWLTGSQSKKLLKQAGDSLAGRVCVLHMYSLSQRELLGLPLAAPLDLSLQGLQARSVDCPPTDVVDVFTRIWRGGMPDVQQLVEEQVNAYWDSYMETYLMRDAVDDNGITDTEGFRKMLRACAAFTGQLVNYNDLAAAAGVSGKTAKEWVKVLCTMGIVFLLEPYFANALKRMVKTPKLYFCDTGFCAYLSSWTSRDALMHGAAAGHFLENYVVGELLRHYAYGAQPAQLNFYRDSNQKEIDLLLDVDGQLHPLEIKLSANPDPRITKSFALLRAAPVPIGTGGVICLAPEPFPLDAQNNLIPATIL